MVFRRLFGGTQPRRIFLGSPEAEAEALEHSRIPLKEVYKDFHDLSSLLNHEKFIVLARKGCGKSAFGEFVQITSKDEPNFFCAFIRPNSINLEAIVQMGNEQGTRIEREILFKWIIYTKLIELLTQNENLKSMRGFDHLVKFSAKNSGYIKIDSYETKEMIKKEGFEIGTEHLRRFFDARYQREFEIKQAKAPFYKLIAHLEKVIKDLMSDSSEKNNQNAYAIFIDDLDIDFQSERASDRDSLLSLLRVAKHINNEVFGKSGIDAKIIILLRTDIAKSISSVSADSAKILSTYSATVDWYNDGYNKKSHEDQYMLKQFINDRIKYIFKQTSRPFNADNPWNSLVLEDGYEHSSFDYIVNQTIFRPRDLLLFFKPLDSEDFEIPLRRHSIMVLGKKYAEELVKELKNELSAFYTSTQIDSIFNALSRIDQFNECPYDSAISTLRESCRDIDPVELLNNLFNHSIVGTKATSGYLYFKFREQISGADSYTVPSTSSILLQRSIRIYCSRRQQ